MHRIYKEFTRMDAAIDFLSISINTDEMWCTQINDVVKLTVANRLTCAITDDTSFRFSLSTMWL
jgi:hypothetical protein